MPILSKSCLAVIALTTVVIAAETPPVARVTFYREKDKGNTFLKNESRMLGRNRDFVGSYGYAWDLLVDGKLFAKLKLGRFVTLELPPGPHEIRTTRSESIPLDLHPNDHVYARPGLFDTWTGLRRPQTLKLVSCSQAVSDSARQPLLPMQSKDVQWGQITKEQKFSTHCSAPYR